MNRLDRLFLILCCGALIAACRPTADPVPTPPSPTPTAGATVAAQPVAVAVPARAQAP